LHVVGDIFHYGASFNCCFFPFLDAHIITHPSFWRVGLSGFSTEEEAVQQGVLQNGMGPIAKKLTLQEARRTRERENTSSPVG